MYKIPRPDAEALMTDDQIKFVLIAIADHLEASGRCLGSFKMNDLSDRERSENKMLSAMASAHSTQAQSLSLYLLLCSGLQR